jgi:hypothetical protein
VKFGAVSVAQQLETSHVNAVPLPAQVADAHRAVHGSGSAVQLNPVAVGAHVAQSPLHMAATGKHVPVVHWLQLPVHGVSQHTRPAQCADAHSVSELHGVARSKPSRPQPTSAIQTTVTGRISGWYLDCRRDSRSAARARGSRLGS